MGMKLFSRQSIITAYVQLDTKKCKACWDCIGSCKQHVIGKVDLPWHKHALIIDPVKCTGCLSCIGTCQYNSFTKVDRAVEAKTKERNRVYNKFLINKLLLFVGFVMIFSGLTLQVGFHMGEHGGSQKDQVITSTKSISYEELREIDQSKIVCGFNYPDWSTIHKYAIVNFSLLMIYHVYAHWNWYKGVFIKHLIGKNIQVITLSVLFLLVAITGLVPWFIDLSGSTNMLRMAFIEIHDKLALVLTVYLILHLVKRFNWYRNTYAKLKE